MAIEKTVQDMLQTLSLYQENSGREIHPGCLPFNMECKKCTSVIAAGVKLNYEREKVTNVFGKLWRFNVKCPCCGFGIVIETFPVRPGYIIVEGAEEHPKRERSRVSEEMLKMMSTKASPRRIRERPRGERKPRLL